MRSPLGEDSNGGGSVKKGPWTPEEDRKLMEYLEKHGCGSWQRIPKLAGINRCGKSCRLRWTNYLRPDIKRGKFTEEDEQLIIHLHSLLGNRWSSIATKLPGRTDNEIKNYWNTHLRKKLLRKGIDPVTHRRTTAAANLNLLASITSLLSSPSNLGSANSDNALNLQTDVVARLLKLQLVQSLFQVLASNSTTCSSSTTTSPNMNLINLLGMPSLVNLISMVPNLSSLGQLLNNHNYIGLSTNTHEELVTTFSDASRSEPSMEKSNVSSTSSYFPAISNSTPPLVSSETDNVDLVKSNSSSNMHAADNSVASTSLEPWEDLKLDNLDNDDFGWKEIIDQMSWSDAS